MDRCIMINELQKIICHAKPTYMTDIGIEYRFIVSEGAGTDLGVFWEMACI